MKKLVFIESENITEEPFTTDELISKYSENKLDSVKRLIRNHSLDLEELGVLGFEIRKMKGKGRPKKIYHLNEQQATLLITYLDNTKPVRKFKKELVKQFFDMKNELFARRLERNTGKNIRLSMTEAIKNADLSPHFYKHYTNLAYKSALGFNATQLRKARNVDSKVSPLDFLTGKELQAVNQRENQIAVLIGLGQEYEAIKSILNGQGVIYQTTLKMPQAII